MKIGPFEITRKKAAVPVTSWPLTPSTGWWPYIRESFAGAWQRGVVTPVQDALTHPTFWACVTLIAGDIAKMELMLVEENERTGISTEIDSPAFSPVLRKPNHYQHRIQFVESWLLSKLTRGNTYVLKERDARNVVVGLYVLDPCRCRPMVTPDGNVYYAVQQDILAGVTEASILIPASEIIHDTMYALYHPLCGLSPVYACGHAAMQGLQIMNNTTRHFTNGAQISGILTAPGIIQPETAKRLEAYWRANYAGADNVGKVAVLGDGLKFDTVKTTLTAVDSQLIDQLKWSDEKICSTFHVPAYMVGVGAPPNYNNIEALNQQYYSQCLQILIESLELCLTEGLNTDPYEIEFDLDGLLRMDSTQKMEFATKGVTGGILSPNEARAPFNLKPVGGGDRLYLQKQNWPLEKLGNDDPLIAPAPQPAPGPPALPPPAKDLSADELDLFARVLKKELAA